MRAPDDDTPTLRAVLSIIVSVAFVALVGTRGAFAQASLSPEAGAGALGIGSGPVPTATPTPTPTPTPEDADVACNAQAGMRWDWFTNKCKNCVYMVTLFKDTWIIDMSIPPFFKHTLLKQ
jgi:hypothetical protein